MTMKMSTTKGNLIAAGVLGDGVSPPLLSFVGVFVRGILILLLTKVRDKDLCVRSNVGDHFDSTVDRTPDHDVLDVVEDQQISFRRTASFVSAGMLESRTLFASSLLVAPSFSKETVAM